jgi:ABC-type polar amino acid transport system ATPase subunit
MKLEIKNLSFGYNQIKIFESFNFQESFETLSLIGPSGSGKSTLLRLLCGLEIPLEGTISWNDKLVPKNEFLLNDFRKQNGVVFQSFNLFPHLTVLENICLALEKVHKKTKKDAKERAFGFLKKFSLEDQATQKPESLSGGQKQRAALIRALVTEPSLLFLDEPTSALDPFMTREVLKMIETLKLEFKIPLVLVTHHLSFAKKIGGHLLILKKGALHKTGKAEKLLHGDEDEIYDQLLK